MILVPELLLVMAMAVLSLIIVVGAWRLAKYEMDYGGNDFRFDIHRGICAAGMFVGAASMTSLCARMVGATTQMIAWPWLGLMYWLSMAAATSFFLLCRYEARIGNHPFWRGG